MCLRIPFCGGTVWGGSSYTIAAQNFDGIICNLAHNERSLTLRGLYVWSLSHSNIDKVKMYGSMLPLYTSTTSLLQNSPSWADSKNLTMEPVNKTVEQLQVACGLHTQNKPHSRNHTIDSSNQSSVISNQQQQQTTSNYPRSSEGSIVPHQQINPAQFYRGQYEYPAEQSPYHGRTSSQTLPQSLPSSVHYPMQEKRGPAPFASFEDLSLASFEMSPDEPLPGLWCNFLQLTHRCMRDRHTHGQCHYLELNSGFCLEPSFGDQPRGLWHPRVPLVDPLRGD